MSLRSLMIVLLLLNVLAFVGGHMGWLGTSGARGEPERLTNQLHPEYIQAGTATVRSVAPNATDTPSQTGRETPPPADHVAQVDPEPEASETPAEAEASAGVEEAPKAQPEAPPPVERSCIAYVVSGQARATEAEKIAQTLGSDIGTRSRTIEEPANWRVRIPPAPTQDAADTRARNLRNLGIADLFVVRDEGPNRYAISLGLFSSESHAKQRLAALKERGIADAQIVPGTVGRFRVEFRGPANLISALSTRLDNALDGAARPTCRP